MLSDTEWNAVLIRAAQDDLRDIMAMAGQPSTADTIETMCKGVLEALEAA